MIATWMLYGTVIAILGGLGALALERGARLLGRAGRWCWVGAMMVTLALPVAAWLRPITPTRLPSAVPLQAPAAVAPAVAPAAPVVPSVVTTPRSWSDFDRPLAYGWCVLSLGLLGWFAVGWARLARMRRSWRSADGVLVSQDVGPAVIGFLRCQVVIPEWSLQLAPEQREMLLAHEAEHLLAHDARLLMASAAVLALVPWNPGLWWQFRRLRLAIELDCDRRVLRRLPDPATYGRLLLDVGARAARTFVPVAAFHEPRSSLEARIRSITSLRPKGAGVLAVALVMIAGGAFFGACEAPRPTAPPAANKPSFTFQTHEEEGRLTSKYIADSVKHYFGSAVTKGPVYLWFVVSPDGHVVRYGTTSRNPADNVIRSQAADSVVPGFSLGTMQSISIVGENTIQPGSQPVYWAVLRDPNRPSQEGHDTSYNAMVPWVGDAMRRYYPGLLASTGGAAVEVWFVSDSAHHVLKTTTVAPHLVGARLGPIHNLRDVFPQFASGTVTSITGGATQGWARDHVTVVWVTQTPNRGS